MSFGMVSMPYLELLSFLQKGDENGQAKEYFVSMPYLGPLSFLRYPSGARYFQGFPVMFLQVII